MHGSGWFMELDDSEMSRWCLETARKGDVSDVMKTLEALLLRTCGHDRLTLSSWRRQSAKLRDNKKMFLVNRLLDLLCKQMLQFHSSYISYKQYVDTHISWHSSLSFWALPGMAAHRATVSEKGCEVGLCFICCFKPKLKDNFHSFHLFHSFIYWNKSEAFKGIQNKKN